MSESYRAAVVLLIPSLQHGGAERVASRLSVLLSQDYHVTVVIFDPECAVYDCGADVVSLGRPSRGGGVLRKLLNAIVRIIKYRQFKKRQSVDLTYSFGDSANIVNVLSGGRDRKITSLRGYGNLRIRPTALDRCLLGPIAKFLHSRADAVVCVSKLLRLEAIRAYDLNPEKVHVIYNGFDVDEIRSKTACSIGSYHQGVGEGAAFVSMGSYRPEKGAESLIRAFGLVSSQYPTSTLTLLGGGSAAAEARLRAVIAAEGVSDRVLLCGFVQNPYARMAGCDCYVLSSVSEGFPNALVEAMACGLPVIATDCPSGPREILHDDPDLGVAVCGVVEADYGLLVEPNLVGDRGRHGPTAALADAMLLMIRRQSLREQYSRLAEARARDFSYGVWRHEHRLLIDGLVLMGPRGRTGKVEA